MVMQVSPANIALYAYARDKGMEFYAFYRAEYQTFGP